MPEFIFQSDNEIIANYLKGYFGADGTVYGKESEGSCNVNCASTSKKLLQEIQMLMDIFGIRTSIKRMRKAGTTTFKDGKTYDTRDTFRLSIDTRDIEKFKNTIGFSVNYKNERLELLLNTRKTVKSQKQLVVITSIEPQENDEPTYNLTEPINNLVYANGILIAQCSEFSAVDNSSCNLASLNLVKYFDPDHHDQFDWTLFGNDIYTLITAMDILVEAADYPTEEIRKVTVATRPLGLGFTNLGALLMTMGYPYDSEEARDVAKTITQQMTTFAYRQSIKLAKKLGPFSECKDNYDSAIVIAKRLCPDDSEVPRGIGEHGLRNSQLTLLAPTGTISFLMDCDTTGIEPLFALEATKTMSDGSIMKIVPRCVDVALSKNSPLDHHLFAEDARHYTKDNPVFHTANEISWKGHIDMMAAVQPHLSGAISKTVNFPSACTPEDVKEAYIYAWKSGIKSLAIYRDGSKELQPLTHVKEEEEEEFVELKQTDIDFNGDIDDIEWKAVRKRLPDTCYGPRHKFNIGGFEGYIRVSTYEDGRPGEMFLNVSKCGSMIQGLLDAFAQMSSLALQYGVPLEHLVEKFTHTTFTPQGFTQNPDIRSCSSVIDYIFQWMALEFLDEDKYNEAVLEQEENLTKFEPFAKITLDGDVCQICGGITQRNGTCYVCSVCGTTSGCS